MGRKVDKKSCKGWKNFILILTLTLITIPA